MIISYHDLLDVKSGLTEEQEYNVLACLAYKVNMVEKSDPDKVYADVILRWIIEGTPGYCGGIEITDVPDPDHVTTRLTEIERSEKGYLLTALLKTSMDERNAFRDAAAQVLERYRDNEDVGARRYTYAALVEGKTDLDAEASHHLIGLLAIRLANRRVNPFLFIIPICDTQIPQAIEISDVPNIATVKREVLERMRSGKIQMAHIVACTK